MDRIDHISKMEASNHNLRAHKSLSKVVDTRYLGETSDVARRADANHAPFQGRFNTHKSTHDKPFVVKRQTTAQLLRDLAPNVM